MRGLVLQGVIFDMDGVIVDSHPAHRIAWREFLRTLGRNVSDRELDFIMDGRRREDILIHFLGPLSDVRLQEYGRKKNALYYQAASEAVPVPGVVEFIEDLAREGIPMAVATSASRKRALFTLRSMGLLNRFGAIVTGDEVPFGKPHPVIYDLACQRIQCSPGNAVAFEDAASGVRAGKSAGLCCVGIAWRQNEEALTAAGADAVFRNFVDVNLGDLRSLVGINSPGSAALDTQTP